jgi:hypothetical protein
MQKNDDRRANPFPFFLKLDRFGWVYYEFSAGLAFSSLYGLLSLTGC